MSSLENRNEQIHELHTSGAGIRTIAKAHSITRQRVSQILKGRPTGEKRGRKLKCTPDRKELCRSMLEAKAKVQDIAAALGVSKVSLHRYMHAQWADLGRLKKQIY